MDNYHKPLCLLLTAVLCLGLLTSCAVPADPIDEEEDDYYESHNWDEYAHADSDRKIVGYTSDDQPIYEDQIYIPEPFYFDEYGVKYVLVEGTIDEYYIDEDYVEEIETPESSAFTVISYRPYGSRLKVQFRNSGVCYVYYDVEPETWYQFKNAESKGSFFNESIKGYYEYDRE